MIRIVKIGLIMTVVLWGVFGALGNVLNWDETLGAVAAVTSMVTFEGGAESWFELWRSEAMGTVLSAALRYGSMIALIAIFVATPDTSEE